MRHFDGLGARVFTLIVFTVAQDHESLADGMVGVFAQQFLFARFVNGIIERGATAIAEAVDPCGKQWHLIGKILSQFALFVESGNECLVETGADDVLEESGGGVFFKSETSLHRAAHIHQKSHFDGQVGLAVEVENRFHRFVIVKN